VPRRLHARASSRPALASAGLCLAFSQKASTSAERAWLVVGLDCSCHHMQFCRSSSAACAQWRMAPVSWVGGGPVPLQAHMQHMPLELEPAGAYVVAGVLRAEGVSGRLLAARRRGRCGGAAQRGRGYAAECERDAAPPRLLQGIDDDVPTMASRQLPRGLKRCSAGALPAAQGREVCRGARSGHPLIVLESFLSATWAGFHSMTTVYLRRVWERALLGRSSARMPHAPS
jgi:hypothetical protein